VARAARALRRRVWKCMVDGWIGLDESSDCEVDVVVVVIVVVMLMGTLYLLDSPRLHAWKCCPRSIA
jgi:hypothetical protein